MENCNLAAQCSLPYRTSVRLSVPPFGDREQNTESGVVVVVVACERLVRPSVRPLRRRRPSRRRSSSARLLYSRRSRKGERKCRTSEGRKKKVDKREKSVDK